MSNRSKVKRAHRAAQRQLSWSLEVPSWRGMCEYTDDQLHLYDHRRHDCSRCLQALATLKEEA